MARNTPSKSMMASNILLKFIIHGVKMKLMYCAECGDIKSMDRNGKPTTCRCGNFTAWWVDPARGTVKARAWDRENVRFIGIDNRFLESSWRIDPQSSKAWRDIQDII